MPTLYLAMKQQRVRIDDLDQAGYDRIVDAGHIIGQCGDGGVASWPVVSL